MIDSDALNGGLFLQVDIIYIIFEVSGKSSVALKLEHSRNEVSGKDEDGCKEDIDRLIDRSTVGYVINKLSTLAETRCCQAKATADQPIKVRVIQQTKISVRQSLPETRNLHDIRAEPCGWASKPLSSINLRILVQQYTTHL